jgi:hypothetical protein
MLGEKQVLRGDEAAAQNDSFRKPGLKPNIYPIVFTGLKAGAST